VTSIWCIYQNLILAEPQSRTAEFCRWLASTASSTSRNHETRSLFPSSSESWRLLLPHIYICLRPRDGVALSSNYNHSSRFPQYSLLTKNLKHIPRSTRYRSLTASNMTFSAIKCRFQLCSHLKHLKTQLLSDAHRRSSAGFSRPLEKAPCFLSTIPRQTGTSPTQSSVSEP
jgi:hypothetical protein